MLRITIVGNDDESSRKQMEKLMMRLVEQKREMLRKVGCFITRISVEPDEGVDEMLNKESSASI